MRRKETPQGFDNVVAIDSQGRLVLPSYVRNDHGITSHNRAAFLHITIDETDRILAFTSNQALIDYARSMARQAASVTEIEIIDFLNYDRVVVPIDTRFRIAIPEALRARANLVDVARVISCQGHVTIVHPTVARRQHENVRARLKKAKEVRMST